MAGKLKPVSGSRFLRKPRNGQKHGPSVNKYAHLVPKRKLTYDPLEKTFRDLPTLGTPGKVVKAGLRLTFHGRLYELTEDVLIPDVAKSIVPGLPYGRSTGLGKYQLVAQID